jgi:hypothetical protein
MEVIIRLYHDGGTQKLLVAVLLASDGLDRSYYIFYPARHWLFFRVEDKSHIEVSI